MSITMNPLFPHIVISNLNSMRLFSVLLLLFDTKHMSSMLLTLFLWFSNVWIVKDGHILTDVIPTEIGLLTALAKLDLRKHFVSDVLLMLWNKTDFSMLLTFVSSIFFHNILIGGNSLIYSIPTEVGLLTKLTDVMLNKRLYSRFTTVL